MNDAPLVSGLERIGNLTCKLDCFVHRQWMRFEPFRQRGALHQFQHETQGRAIPTFQILHAVDRANVRMVHRCEDLRLALEPCDPLRISGKGGWQNLDRDMTT